MAGFGSGEEVGVVYPCEEARGEASDERYGAGGNMCLLKQDSWAILLLVSCQALGPLKILPKEKGNIFQ